MRRALMSLIAIGLLRCVTPRGAPPVLPAADLEIIATVLQDPSLFDAPGMGEHPAVADRTYFSLELFSLSERLPTALELCGFSGRDRECSHVPASTVASLVDGNRHEWTLPSSLPLPLVHVCADLPKEVARIVLLSRPGMSEDGNSAIVAVERMYPQPNFGPDGFLVYLERANGAWRVVQHGGLWIV